MSSALLVNISITVLMAVSLYLPMATGSLFIMPLGAMCVGAYASSEITLHGDGTAVAFIAAAVAGGIISLLAGLVVVRLQSWSSAIASLAMVEVIQVFFQNFSPTGGSAGLLGVPLFTPLSLSYVLAIAVVVILVALEIGRTGDVLEAIRDDELAAASSGVRIRLVRLGTFLASGIIAGLGGALSAGYLGFVDPSTYGFAQLNSYLLAAVFGGSTTALGSLFGGALVNLIPQFVSFAANNSLIIFSLVVIVVMLVRRQGLITRRMVKQAAAAVGRLGPAVRIPRRRPAAGLPRYLADRPVFSQLAARGVCKSYGGVQVLHEVDMEVSRGEVVGIIGANGAGKTTLVNVLTGVVRCDMGHVELSGGPVSTALRRFTAGKAVRMGIARTFQHERLFPGLTVAEHVSLLRGSDAAAALSMVGLTGSADARAADLPYGDQRLVDIARAMVTKPTFLILDEPAAGMTRQESAEVAGLIQRICADGVGVIVIDHNVEFTSGVSDRMIAMDFGEVIAAGSPAEVLANQAVIDAYLGGPSPLFDGGPAAAAPEPAAFIERYPTNQRRGSDDPA
jgi:branched-chain amino acid transport system permease protein